MVWGDKGNSIPEFIDVELCCSDGRRPLIKHGAGISKCYDYLILSLYNFMIF
jgi:hypothetical protein